MTVNELTYFPISGYLGNTTVNGAELPFNATVVCTPRLPAGFTALISNLDTGSGTGADTALAFPPQEFDSVDGVVAGFLLANDSAVLGPALAAAGITQLWYDVNFTRVSLGYQVPQNFSFPAPTTSAPVSLTGPSLTRYAYGGTVPTVSLPEGVTAFGVELIGAADEAAARALLGLGPSWPFPMARNTFAAIGDSMAAKNSLGNTGLGRPNELQPALNATSFQMLQILSHQRLRYCGGLYAISGSLVAEQISFQLPLVLAMNPLPGACLLACGAAEMVTNASYSFAACQAELESMVAQLLAVGVYPILWTIPPAYSSQPVAPSVYRPNIRQWNAWIRLYADRNGFAVVDAYTALADVNGVYLAGMSDDGLHPNAEGHKQIVIRTLADGVAEIFPKNTLVHTIRSTDDLNNLLNDGTINQGLFTSDSNSDGIADGLTQSGTSVNILVAPVPTDQLLGNWQQMTVAAGNTASLSKSFTGWSVGDKLAVAARIQTSNMVASAATFSLGVQASIPGGLTLSDTTSVTSTPNGINSWLAADLTDGEVYVEFTISAGTTQLSFQASISSVTSGTATLRFGEATVRNLTTGDLLT